jgi:hypothetical protein
LKPFSPLFVFWAWLASRAPPCGADWASASKKIGTSSRPGRHCERGFLLLFLLPCLLLAFALLAGTIKVVNASQQRIAMQSRLDICAVRLLEIRRSAAKEFVRTNSILRSTALAIAMARGAILLGGPAGALLGKAGEAALLRLNQATAQWQEARVWFFQARELSLHRCSPTPFSRKEALCQVSPSLKEGLKRSPSLFPDVRGPLQFLKGPLARVRCQSFTLLRTTLVLEGDPSLTTGNFADHYEE